MIILNIKKLQKAVSTHTCEYCECRAATQGNLRRHVQSINIKVKYNCESCEYKASTKGSL